MKTRFVLTLWILSCFVSLAAAQTSESAPSTSSAGSDEKPKADLLQKILGGAVPADKATPKDAVPKPLYERLGGVYGIAALVDDFVDRLLADPVIGGNPKLAVGRERIPGLKVHITALVCEVSGGPEKYTGRSMPDSHAGMNIDEKQWQAMVNDLVKSLDRFQVPAAERAELLAVIASTKGDIVTHEAPKETSR